MDLAKKLISSLAKAAGRAIWKKFLAGLSLAVVCHLSAGCTSASYLKTGNLPNRGYQQNNGGQPRLTPNEKSARYGYAETAYNREYNPGYGNDGGYTNNSRQPYTPGYGYGEYGNISAEDASYNRRHGIPPVQEWGGNPRQYPGILPGETLREAKYRILRALDRAENQLRQVANYFY